MENENNLPTRRYQEVAVRLKPSMSGFRTIEADEADAARQTVVALSRTCSYPSAGRTATFNKVGGKTGIQGRVGGKTGVQARVGSRTGMQTRVGGQTTAMQTRVGGNTGAFGVVTGSQSPVRRAVERQKRSTAVDPMIGVLAGVGIFFVAILIYGLSKPVAVPTSPEPAQLSQEEQNRLARAINVERAKQAKLLYKDEDQKAAVPAKPVDRGFAALKDAPPPARSVESRRVSEPIRERQPSLLTGGVATGEIAVSVPRSLKTEPLRGEEEVMAAIPPKPEIPRMATGGVAAGMSAELSARNVVATAPVEAAPAAPAQPAPKVQRSKKDAPHGGVMYEVGPGVALLEFHLDRMTGQLNVYVLDTVSLNRVVVRQPTLELQVPAYAQVFTLRGQRNASAQFAGQYDLLRGENVKIRALIPSIVVNGKEVTEIGVEF